MTASLATKHSYSVLIEQESEGQISFQVGWATILQGIARKRFCEANVECRM